MSGADVLAVIDHVSSVERDWGDTQLVQMLTEARAAMAELMEANRSLIARHDEDAKLANFDRCGCSVCVELRAALARCGVSK